MAVDPCSCSRLAQAAQRSGKILQVCHNMRYTPFFQTVKQLLHEKRIGEIVTVQHSENIAYWHMAHSFVRGKWGNQAHSSPMILAKSCHDMDLLVWLVDKKPARVSSFGSLYHFRRGRESQDIPERCTDGCPLEPTCAFSTIKFYLGENTDWPVSMISLDRSLEARRRALETGPYGRCVYRCDNDAVDHQVVIIEFDDGVTASFTMQGHSHEGARTIRYCGTEGTLRGHCERGIIDLHPHGRGERQQIDVPPDVGGHGGGDWRLIESFCRSVRQDDPGTVLTSAEASLVGHLICFAAEKSRQEGIMVEMDSFRGEIEAAVLERDFVPR